jgi:intracellular multiplication protein IcmL
LSQAKASTGTGAPQGRGQKSAVKPTAQSGGSSVPKLEDEGDIAFASVLLRSKVVRERYYLLMRTIYVLGGCLALSVFGNVVQAIRPTHPLVIAMSDDGRIIPIIPLAKPVMSTNSMDTWVATAVTKSLDITFSTMGADIQASQQYFTPSGWKAFQQGLVSANLLDSIKSNKYNEYAVPAGAPVLLSAPGAVDGDGVAYWVWQFPVIVTLESADTQQSRNYTVTVTVTRVPQAQNPSGLGITGFVEQ